MSAEVLLQKLAKVKRIGKDKWSACCPAHDDRGPSLAIKETADGRILLHCFAGCGAAEIVDTLGLTFSDLFPAMHFDGQSVKPVRKPWNPGDVLSALSLEILIAWNYAKVLANGEVLAETDRDRLLLCASRMQKGLEVARG